LAQPIEQVAPLLLERCRQKAEKRARNFAGQSPKKRHALRIALKKLRYAVELLGSLYDPAENRRFIHRLKRLQDGLGDINDVRVGRTIVAALPRAGAGARGIAQAGRRVIAWHKHRLSRDEGGLRHHLDQLMSVPRFW
jgi:triphosphatase